MQRGHAARSRLRWTGPANWTSFGAAAVRLAAVAVAVAVAGEQLATGNNGALEMLRDIW